MLALSNAYFLQSRTELTSYSTVRESHTQAVVPRVLPYPCMPELVQFTPHITPASCYPYTAHQPQHDAPVFMNLSGNRQNSASRSQAYFENDLSYKTFNNTSRCYLSRNLSRSNYTLQSISTPGCLHNLKSVGNKASRRNHSQCSHEEEAIVHSMEKLKTSIRSPFHDRLSSSFHIQENHSCISFEEQENTQIPAQQMIQEIHAEDTSCQENQQFGDAQRVSSACKKLNHSIASILNISSGNTDNQMYTPCKSNQETDNTSSTNDNHQEFSKTYDILTSEDTVVSEQNGYFDDDLEPPSKQCDDSTSFQNSAKVERNEFSETCNLESTPRSTDSARYDSMHSVEECHNVGDIDVVTINTAKHNNHSVHHVNASTMTTKVQDVPVVQNTKVLHDANNALNNIRNNKYPWSHHTKHVDHTPEVLHKSQTVPSSCSQLPFMRITTSSATLPPFHTLSPLHRKGAYDKASAFKPISKLPISTHQFPDYVAPYENWTCRSFLPQNSRTSSVNRLVNPSTVYGSSGIYLKCINDFPNLNNTFDDSVSEQQNGLFYQRQGIPNLLNSSEATAANESDPENLDRWMAWLRQTESHSTKSSQFDERISSRVAPPPRYHCDFCNKTYSTFGGLSKHRQFHCSQHVKKEFSCKLCNRAYSSLGALKMHIRTHTLPCKCQECGKAFSRPWLLQGHLRTHTGEKPFKCSHCGRAFADRSNLRAHLQTHAEIKRYACSKCAKTFSRMSLLSKHAQGSCLANIKHR